MELINEIKKGLELTPILYTSDLNKNYQRVKLSGEFILKSKYIFIV